MRVVEYEDKIDLGLLTELINYSANSSKKVLIKAGKEANSNLMQVLQKYHINTLDNMQEYFNNGTLYFNHPDLGNIKLIHDKSLDCIKPSDKISRNTYSLYINNKIKLEKKNSYVYERFNKKWYETSTDEIKSFENLKIKTDSINPDTSGEVEFTLKPNKILSSPEWETLDRFNENLEEEIIGKKESNNKLNYELDWDFITAMAERISSNKHKYAPYNWKKPIDIEEIKQALFRHTIEVMKGNFEDDKRVLGHLEAIAVNTMIINYHLK